MLLIRKAKPEDDRRVGELLVDAFVSAYAEKMPDVVVTEERKAALRDMSTKRNNATVLVAELEGRVIGTVMIIPANSKASEAWLEGFADLRHLAVEVALHGRGFSAPLLDEAERIALEEWKCSGICLHVRRGAHGVARLYQKRGFERDLSGDIARTEVFLEAYVLRFQK